MYRTLDPNKIIDTLALLESRISERFPGAGLRQVCVELTQIARETTARIADISRPTVWLRVMIAAILLSGLALLAYVGSIVHFKSESENLFGVLQGIEASINILVLTGAAVLFLFTVETRWKRQRIIEEMHELRSIVHVIDMHQLTKDPSTAATVGDTTPSSPERVMSPYELTRYLDYCSEMLSLTAKIAVLYAQSTKDPTVIDEASDIGQITSNLSNKIWQKINIVQTTGHQQSSGLQQPGAAASVSRIA